MGLPGDAGSSDTARSPRFVARAAALALAAMLGALPCRTGAAAAEPPLTAHQVSEVVATMRALAPIVTRNRAALEQYTRTRKGGGAGGTDPCRPAADARKVPGYADAERVVKEHGFADGERYCRTSLRVFAACGVVRADQERPGWRDELAKRDEQVAQARAQMSRMLKELDGDNDLSAEQKEQLRRQLAQMIGDLDGPAGNPLVDMIEGVSDADKAAVAPHCAELETLARQMAD